MARKASTGMSWKPETRPKKTSQGKSTNTSKSGMNKAKKRSRKKYRGQGK